MGNSVRTPLNENYEESILEVPYIVLAFTQEQEKAQLLQAIATAINVQLTLGEDTRIPFIAPSNFQQANNQDKLFSYGPGGSGKSRLIFELVKAKLNEKIKRLYIINPRQAIDKNIQRTHLVQLIDRFTSEDIVVWDNFPDGLIKKDIDTSKLVLEIISSSEAKNILIALKPKFLEIYRGITDGIPELYGYQVSYDFNQIREIIKLYGTETEQYRELFTKQIANNITSIAKVLWQKEPIPMTVLNYYRELLGKENDTKQLLDAVSAAQNIQYPSSYYEYQFEHLVKSNTRVCDAEFLYTIKLCYDLMLDRKMSLVESLQSKIFGSTPPKEVAGNLGSWIYLSGQYVSMHDVPRDAIKFNNQTILKIMNYLTSNFSDVVSDDENQLTSIGIFLGRNIQLLLQYEQNEPNQEYFLPYNIHQHMKSQRALEMAIGRGTGDVFYMLDLQLQEQILSRIGIDGEFARGLGESLGNNFEDLDYQIRTDMLSKGINQSILFARGLGESLGSNFYKFSKQLQDEIFQISLKEKNYYFPRGLGAGLGRTFRYLENDVQRHLINLTSKHVALAIGVGYGLGFVFSSSSSSLSEEFHDYIKRIAKGNGEITRGLGMGLGQNYPFLNETLQNEILKLTEKDPRLEFGFAYQVSLLFTSLTKEHQNFILDRVERNTEFAYGSGWGFGVVYTYLQKQIQRRLLDLTKNKVRFAIGLGSGLGNHIQYLTKEIEEELFSNIKNNEGFAIGVGFGIGRSFTFLDQELQVRVWGLMRTNYMFSVGLGWGLGFIFPYLNESLHSKILEYIHKELGLATGFGWGLGFMFAYLSKDLQHKSELMVSQNQQFAFGFGVGLGSLFKYLPQRSQMESWSRAENNIQFAIGLGTELGYLFDYLPTELQQDILSRSGSSFSIARGLGWGLGHIFISVSKDRQEYFLRIAQSNPQLLRGLGWGLGHVLSYLSAELQELIIKMASTHVQFAIGLGEGLGYVFQYLDNQLRQTTIQLCDKNNAFAKGLGRGLGHVISYLQLESQHELWRRAENNVQFAIGLGESTGENIGFLSSPFQKQILSRLEQNAPLSRGFGSGLGSWHYFYPTDENITSDKIADYIKKNKEFSRGYGECLGRLFSYWTESILNDIIMPNIASNTQFAIGLGEGIGQSLPYDIWKSIVNKNMSTHPQKTDKNITILENLFATDVFSYGVGIGFFSIIDCVPEQIRSVILKTLVPKYQNFSFGFGYGIGRAFLSLSQELQDEMLELAGKSDEFARGFGQGISFIFKNLESITKQGLLLFLEKSFGFARGFGQGIGYVFPTLNQELQDEMLELAEKSDEFARGFGQGISHSIPYLNEWSQKKLPVKIKDYIKSNLLAEMKNTNIITEFDHYTNDYLIFLPQDDYTPLSDTDNRVVQQKSDLSKERYLDDEISFSGRREEYCMCYIDMMNSTQVSSTLNDLQLSRYYSTFLNSMATIAKNFGARIIKNAGDCLIYYFPHTLKSGGQNVFKNVIECGITMISAHQAINTKLFDEGLPPLNYRISADYGKVEIAKSSSSQTEDLFGSSMNVCAKINSKAPPNGMAIGYNLYKIVSIVMQKEYNFERAGEYTGFKEIYPVYSIKLKQKRNILNPFRRVAEPLFDSHLDSSHFDRNEDNYFVNH